MLEFMIGAASFFCGFALMFAIHRVMFDYYDEDAKQEIYDLKCEVKALQGDNFQLKQQLKFKKDIVEVTEVHCYATPADVADLDFLEG